LVKLGILVSPRTVRKYMPKPPLGRPRGDQRWSTFLRNHAKAVVACDFFVAVMATFRLFYVLVLIEHCSRRLVHFNTTQHPTADWTLQQLREAIGCGDAYRYVLHDRDSIFGRALGAARQIDTGRLASRIFAGARNPLTELLRITGGDHGCILRW
jgi:putative transposase